MAWFLEGLDEFPKQSSEGPRSTSTLVSQSAGVATRFGVLLFWKRSVAVQTQSSCRSTTDHAAEQAAEQNHRFLADWVMVGQNPELWQEVDLPCTSVPLGDQPKSPKSRTNQRPHR